jgi:hypothetical protein
VFIAILLSHLLFAQNLLAAPKFRNVPTDCVEILKAFSGGKTSKALRSVINWEPVLQNMIRLGYTREIATIKLENLQWQFGMTKYLIQQTLDRPQWDWGQTLSREDAFAIGQQISKPYSFGNTLSTLIFVDALKHIDTPALVNGYLSANQADAKEIDMIWLANTAPLWLKGDLGPENAHLFFSNSKASEAQLLTSWLVHFLPPSKRESVKALVRQQLSAKFTDLKGVPAEKAAAVLSSLSCLPLPQLPPAVHEELTVWLDLKNYPAVQLSNVQHISRGHGSDGTCSDMSNGHILSLRLLPEPKSISWEMEQNDATPVLIVMNGIVLGSVKQSGDPSFLALRNVVDEEGHLVLAMGGVYRLAKSLLQEIKHNKTVTLGRWKILKVDQLRVQPATFLLNHEAWSNFNYSLLIPALKNELSKDDLLKVIRELSGEASFIGDDGDRNFALKLHKIMWSKLLKSMHQVTIRAEKLMNTNQSSTTNP